MCVYLPIFFGGQKVLPMFLYHNRVFPEIPVSYTDRCKPDLFLYDISRSNGWIYSIIAPNCRRNYPLLENV